MHYGGITLVTNNRDAAQEQDQQLIPLPKVTIQQIERLVCDLQAEIERGTIQVDAAFAVIAQRIVEQLQAVMRRYFEGNI